jgi:hypothetical protein
MAWLTVARIAVCSLTCVVLGAQRLNGGEALRMQVSPSVSRAPAALTVRLMVEATAGDRTLKVIAESPDFYRSSEISIDGAHAAPLNVFQFRGLPTGLYQVTAVLAGTHGARATALKLARVEPGIGSPR